MGSTGWGYPCEGDGSFQGTYARNIRIQEHKDGIYSVSKYEIIGLCAGEKCELRF